MSHFLTKLEILSERTLQRSEDASERLALISEAMDDAMRVICRAVDEFIADLDRHRRDAKDVPEKERADTLDFIRERLDEMSHDAVADLIDWRDGEGKYGDDWVDS